MLCVGRGGGDLGVAPRRVQALVGDGREVVTVDQIVSHAGMIRLLGEGLLEERRRFELVRVGLVAGVESDVERQRIEDGGFPVLRILRGQRVHGLLVILRARAMVDLVVVLVEGLDGGEVVELALGLGAHALALGHRRGPQLEVLGRRGAGQGIPESGHRRTPIGDAAGGIGLGRGLESLDRIGEPEGVEQGHGPGELRLGGGVTGGREVDSAESLGGLRPARRHREH